MKQDQFKIPNLMCSGCAETITTGLKALEGIAHIQVDIQEKLVILEYEEFLSREVIVHQLSNLGYPESAPPTTSQKVQSFLGRLILGN